ncbi:CHAD domain-containing protein, partial [Streptomyces tricolor]
MAQQHLDPTDPTADAATGDALAGYLRAQATEFLRALRLHRESGGSSAGGAEGSVDAARALRRSARRISGTLHTFRPLLDPDWSEEIRPELAWLSGTLGMEHAYEARLERLLLALHRLSGSTAFPAQTVTAPAAGPGDPATAAARGSRAAGAARTAAPAPLGPGGPAGRGGPPERGTKPGGAAMGGAWGVRQRSLARARAHAP